MLQDGNKKINFRFFIVIFFIFFRGSNGYEPISNQQLQTSLKVINFNDSTRCNSRDWFEYCTINEIGNSNVCQGDGGSPLVYFKNNRWHVYGIASHGARIESCDGTEPSYQTMVPNYLDWIRRAMKTTFMEDENFIDFE